MNFNKSDFEILVFVCQKTYLRCWRYGSLFKSPQFFQKTHLFLASFSGTSELPVISA